MICAGIDAGSRTIKVVLMESSKTKGKAKGTFNVLASGISDQGVKQDALALDLFNRLLAQSGLKPSDVARTVATGYGRNLIGFADTTVTEITCQAAGVFHLIPKVRTIIDIGGQDSKVIHLTPDGNVRDFAMNDRCAAGTGRFLEIVAQRLEGNLYSVSEASINCRKPAVISSMCVVFAETEIIGLLAAGAIKEDVMGGVQAAVASRIAGMTGRHAKAPFYFTGGVALVPGMQQALSKALEEEILLSQYAQYTGALGAAILASRQKKITVGKESHAHRL